MGMANWWDNNNIFHLVFFWPLNRPRFQLLFSGAYCFSQTVTATKTSHRQQNGFSLISQDVSANCDNGDDTSVKIVIAGNAMVRRYDPVIYRLPARSFSSKLSNTLMVILLEV